MGKKLTDKERKQMIADYAECGNYCEVARLHGVGESTVRNVVKGDERTAKLCEQKKERNSEDILAYMEAQKGRVCGFIDVYLKALLNEEKIQKATVNQLSTALGTVIDKFTIIKNDAGTEQKLKDALTTMEEAFKRNEPGTD